MSGQGAHLKLLCDDAKHPLDGSEAAHKLLLGSINLGGITISIFLIIIVSIVVIIIIIIIIMIIIIISSIIINLVGITIIIFVIIVIVIINTTVVTTVLLYTSSIFYIAVNNHKTLQPTWQARLFRRKIPARCK